MFNEPKPLLVVYKEKDEMILNQLKKLIDTKDDGESDNIVGTEDGTVKIVSWDEKLWLQNKKAGNTGDLADKILFLGEIKGTEKLAPVLDVKFNKHGVSYGFAGNQALLTIDAKALSNRKNYETFLEELGDTTDLAIAKQDKKQKPGEKKQWFKVGVAVAAFTTAIPMVGALASGSFYKDYFDDKKLVRNQMMIYGITKLYMDDLDSFMKA